VNNADKNAGKKWPWIIGISTLIVVGFGASTIKVAINNPVELSNYGMQTYQNYDEHANDIIKAKIAFNQNYTLSFLTPQISEKGTVIQYALTDKSGKAVNDAQFQVVMTRPDTTKCDINITEPTIENGKYTFKPVDLPKVGRWDILAKVSVGDKQRFYNIKADTRSSTTFEF
jgi:nitrogen fixation protein FixH